MTDSLSSVAAAERARQAARQALIEYAVIHADRDNRIRYAAALGTSRTDIAALVGLTRQHVHRILAGQK